MVYTNQIIFDLTATIFARLSYENGCELDNMVSLSSLPDNSALGILRFGGQLLGGKSTFCGFTFGGKLYLWFVTLCCGECHQFNVDIPQMVSFI